MAEAAAVAGISRDTLYEWKRRGEAERRRIDDGEPAELAEDAFLQFADAIRVAEGEAMVEVVGAWYRAALTDWRAARDLLARRYPREWGGRVYPEDDPERRGITLAELERLLVVDA
jgi:hypothetical protein